MTMWCYKDDNTRPVFTARERCGRSGEVQLSLPKTAVLLYMSGLDYILEQYPSELLTDRFPRFLSQCPIYQTGGVCFLDGGRGAPMAVDTIETLNALGVENVISVGMIGGFAEDIQVGNVVIPDRAYVEEGTSLHYFERLDYSQPNPELFKKLANDVPGHRIAPIISTDAPYRQTFRKEQLWRDRDCVGVDMETSALFSVGKYLGLNVAAVLVVSDKHPMNPDGEKWQWKITKELRKKVIYQAMDFALSL